MYFRIDLMSFIGWRLFVSVRYFFKWIKKMKPFRSRKLIDRLIIALTCVIVLIIILVIFYINSYIELSEQLRMQSNLTQNIHDPIIIQRNEIDFIRYGL